MKKETYLKKYELSIEAHLGDEEQVMTIFRQQFVFNIMTHTESFIYILRNMMSIVDWRFDDGDIEAGTEYLQYSAYPEEGNNENYLLATWCKIRDYEENELFENK